MKVSHPSPKQTPSSPRGRGGKAMIMSTIGIVGCIALFYTGRQEGNRIAASSYLRSKAESQKAIQLQTPSPRRNAFANNVATETTMTNTQSTKSTRLAPPPPPSPSHENQLALVPLEENWRGAPVGDGEDTLDSYHSYDHRPSGSDPRDELLKQYTIYRCPNDGVGSMISGQDPRYYEIDPPDNKDYKERNPKFLCDVAKLPQSPHQPCVVYSFGSWDEISFEVGMNQATDQRCHIHTFDPIKPPSAETASRNHFIAHQMGIGNADSDQVDNDESGGGGGNTIKKLSSIMKQLGHSHIHVLKIDVEGHERESLPNIVEEGILEHVDQLSIEFHSNDLMKQGLDLLVGAGFGIVYARREDRCGWCTEVTMVKII